MREGKGGEEGRSFHDEKVSSRRYYEKSNRIRK